MNLFKYRLKCTTDNKKEYVWLEDNQPVPTLCPTNSAHSVDTSETTIVDKIDNTEVIVKEEDIKTGGHFQTKSFDISCDATSGWKEMTFSFPFSISLLSATWICKTENGGDHVQFLVSPDTIIGTITADVAASATVIDVQQSVIDNTFVGANIKLDDGTNADNVGVVISIDKTNNKITIETATTNSFLTATPTYIKQTVEMSPHIRLHGEGPIAIGESKIGGSNIPANTTLKASYNNISATAKTFTFILEYLY